MRFVTLIVLVKIPLPTCLTLHMDMKGLNGSKGVIRRIETAHIRFDTTAASLWVLTRSVGNGFNGGF